MSTKLALVAAKFTAKRSNSLHTLDALSEANRLEPSPAFLKSKHPLLGGSTPCSPHNFRPAFVRINPKVLPAWSGTSLGSICQLPGSSALDSTSIRRCMVDSDKSLHEDSSATGTHISKEPCDRMKGIPIIKTRKGLETRDLLQKKYSKVDEPFESFTVVMGALNPRINKSSVISSIHFDLLEKSELAKVKRNPIKLCRNLNPLFGSTPKVGLKSALKGPQKDCGLDARTSSSTSLSPCKSVHFSKYLLYIKEGDAGR